MLLLLFYPVHKDLITVRLSAELSKYGIFLRIELKKGELPPPAPWHGVCFLNAMPRVWYYFITNLDRDIGL